MATSTVTPEVNSSAIPPSAISSSPSTAPAETSSPTAAPESTTGNSVESQPRAAVPHEQSQNGELSPQDFSSLEDYAKALIEKKQSTASRDRSAVEEDKSTQISAEQDRNDAGVNEVQPEEEDQGAQSEAAVDFQLDGEDYLSTKALND